MNFFASLKSLKTGVKSGSGVGSESISQRVGMDPGIRIRIRTKMSRIHPQHFQHSYPAVKWTNAKRP
jgi:hypothetical protein